MSSSTSELPTSRPMALRKVNAIPPPMMTLFTFFPRFSITPILPDTLAPPRMATKGRMGSATAPSRYSISLRMRKPAPAMGRYFVMPETARDGGQAQARVHLPFGAPQMGAQDHPRAFVHRVVDGREGTPDAGIVRDVAALVQRYVEVRADDDALAPKRQVLDGDFVQMHAERLGMLSRGRPCI